jgi:hypothetical protein
LTDDRSGSPRGVEPVLESLSQIERAVYELILRAGDLMAKDIPFKMAGVIPSLKRKGLVEAYKRPATPGSKKKQTFLKVKKRG